MFDQANGAAMTFERLKPWLLGLLLLYSLAHFALTGIWSALGLRGGDILSVFPGPLISGREQFGADTSNPTWNYGPVAQFWTYPLGFTRSVPTAMLTLLMVNYMLLGIAFLMWLTELSNENDKGTTAAIMLIIWLNYFPFLQALVGREIEVLEFFLLTLSFYLLRRGREAGAGCLIGLATMTKFLPGIFIPYLFLKGRWRAACSSMIVIILLALIGQGLLGFQHSLTFSLARDWSSLPIFRPHADNQAMINVVQRALNTGIDPDQHLVTPAFPRASKIVGILLQVAVTGLVFLAMWKRRTLPINAWEYSIVLITMIVIPPWSNIYYLMFLVVPFSAGFVWYSQSQDAVPYDVVALVIAYLLSGYVVPISFLAYAFSLSPIAMRNLLGHLSLPGIGMLILFASFWAFEQYCRQGEVRRH